MIFLFFLTILKMAFGIMAAPHESSSALDVIQPPAKKKIPANFKASCSDVRFFDPRDLVDEGDKRKDSTPYLMAKCGDGNGGQKCSWMPLTACFANAHGKIVYRRYGAFFKSCADCKYENVGTNMTCECTGPKGSVKSVVNLILLVATTLVMAAPTDANEWKNDDNFLHNCEFVNFGLGDENQNPWIHHACPLDRPPYMQ
ncbi:hypothetical protein BDP55DRAFT_734167 [Colletotrichum godetiae]|uniref:Cyanovirin-N domain-containing protein n=1 Tax=Colletotrichum godetiae TaxID=1209918 RepID=A0AAJ0A8F4_9PEZI|nr:uncharacterized protein BDP55DRAFT_734167 [Colletotrichum godetiae]KAK1658407.1 hypothetical protein BDP55DRAFT_734167 [Colletotrichum godetiae]